MAAVTKVSGVLHDPCPGLATGGSLVGDALPSSSLQLCAEDVKDFLEHMAVVRINKGWEFLLPYDLEFIKKHPDVVQRQHMLWSGIQAK